MLLIQTQQAEEKPPSTEAAPDQSPAEFWSRLKNAQGKTVPMVPKEGNQASAATENKPTSVPTSPATQQSHTTKVEEKEPETKKERPQTKEFKEPASHNVDAVNKLGEAAKKMEVKLPETNSNNVTLENGKTEQSESPKQAVVTEEELVKGKVDLSKGALSNDTKQPATALPFSIEQKTTAPKPNVEEVKSVDVAEPRTSWAKESPENKGTKPQEKTPESYAKEVDAEVKKMEEQPSLKQGIRGVIRMNNLNSKPQQAAETEDHMEAQKDDIKLLKKEDTPSLKSALVGESSASSAPEKKTVTFAEPLNEGGEIKVKDLPGKDGKIIAPSTLGLFICLFFC